jgi:hypothetical protein
MSKSTKGAAAAGGVLRSTTPTGKNPTGKAQAQDIELNPKSTPAGGKGPGVGSQEVPLDKQISALLNKNGNLKDESPEAVQKLTQIIGRWEVNETTRLSTLGGKEIQKSVLKYLKRSGNQEMYVSALAKHDPSNGKMPAREFQDDYNEFVQQPVPRQERAPLESTGNSPTSRPDNRTGRGGKNSDTVSTQERVSEATARILDGKGTDEDFDFVLKQGLGWNEKKQNGAFLDEFQAAASTQDVNKRAEIIERMSQNASAVGNNSKQAQPFLQRRFNEYIERQLPLYEAAKPSGGGVKIGDGPLPGEKQQSLDFDGGGDTAKAGPEIALNTDPKIKDERLRKINPNAKPTYDALETDAEKLAYLKTKRGDDGVKGYKPADGNLVGWELREYKRLTGTQTNRAANATGTEPELPNHAASGDNTTRADNANQTANTTEGPGPQTAEPKGDFGAENEMPELEAWARSHLISAYMKKHGVDPTQNAKHAKRFQQGWEKFMQQVGQQPDPLETLRQFKQNNVNAPQGAGPAGPRQSQRNRQTPNQAASPGNQTRNTTQPVQPGRTPSPGPGANAPMAATGIAPPPGYKGPTPGKGGSVSGLKTGGKSELPQKGMSPDEWEARAIAKEKEFKALDNEINTNRWKAAGGAAAAGVAGSLAWQWLAGGDDDSEGQPTLKSASITGGPSTSIGPAGGAVADGSGDSAGGMSQEQMENMMKLQQIRDEQKRRFIGTGSGAQGVYR